MEGLGHSARETGPEKADSSSLRFSESQTGTAVRRDSFRGGIAGLRDEIQPVAAAYHQM